MPKQCHQCGKENTEQAYCGFCGSPLDLGDFISKKVKDELVESLRDRDVLEAESSIKVFKEAWGWMKIILGIAATLLVLFGGEYFLKLSEFRSSVDQAERKVTESANTKSGEITNLSDKSKQDISAALDEGKKSIQRASNDVTQRAKSLRKTANQTIAEFSKESTSFQDALDKSRAQLRAADQLGPTMKAMQIQLEQATDAINAQKRVLSSSEELAKSIFSSHTADYFRIGESPKDRYAVLQPAKKGDPTGVFLLLKSAPISATLQLQIGNITPQQNQFQNIHNLVYFACGDCTPDGMKTQVLSVSYFPDPSDKETINGLTERDGRIFADDQPLRNFNQPVDPDFKGNKWTPPDSVPTKPQPDREN
jgi:hypothetical protein